MAKYLVDANLPYRLQVFNSPDFLFARELGLEKDDDAIWEFAKQNRLIIITRDFDFYKVPTSC